MIQYVARYMSLNCLLCVIVTLTYHYELITGEITGLSMGLLWLYTLWQLKCYENQMQIKFVCFSRRCQSDIECTTLFQNIWASLLAQNKMVIFIRELSSKYVEMGMDGWGRCMKAMFAQVLKKVEQFETMCEMELRFQSSLPKTGYWQLC